MARTNINVGTSANDGTGDTLRDAFIAVNAMTTEIYGNNFVTNAMLQDDAVDSAEIADGAIDTVHIGDDQVTNDKLADDAVDSDQIADGAIDNVHLADDIVDHDELAARYTASTSVTANGGGEPIDWSSAAVFNVTLSAADTLNFSNFKKGQVIDLIITGNYTLTFGTASGTPTFNKVGSTDYDGTSTNLIQVLCTDDATNGVFYYAIGTYTSDSTP